MKHLEKRFLSPDNIFKIHWVTIKTAAAAAFYNFEPFLTHIRVQFLFHFRFLCSGWSGSNPMGSNTCPDSGLQPTAKKKISRSKCCFITGKFCEIRSLNSIVCDTATVFKRELARSRFLRSLFFCLFLIEIFFAFF